MNLLIILLSETAVNSHAVTISIIGLVGIIITAIAGGLSPLLLLWYKNKLENKKYKQKKKQFNDEIHFSDGIERVLEQKRKDMGCERIWVTHFHNGGNFYPTNRSIQKSSIVYEVRGKLKRAIAPDFQNVAINMFARVMKHLSEGNIIEVYDTGNFDEDKWGLKGVYNDRGTLTGYMLPIMATNIVGGQLETNFIGTIGFDYDVVFKLSVETLDELKVWVNGLGEVMMEHLED